MPAATAPTIMRNPATTAPITDGTAEALDALHHDCFACGVGNQSGLNLHFSVGDDGLATATWQPTAAFRSYPDRVHGGVIATLLDSAIVHALFARGIAGVTAELTVRYLRGVNITDAIRVEARVDFTRRGIYFCSAEVYQAESLAVRSSAKFMRMPTPSVAPCQVRGAQTILLHPKK